MSSKRKKNRKQKVIYDPTRGQRIKTNNNIPEHILFSFKYTDILHPKFCIVNKKAKYFRKVIEIFKDISSYPCIELIANRSGSLRFNYINWERTSEKEGFSHLNEQLRDCPAFEFSVSANEYGRIHGFLTSGIFNIVWFDPDHNLFTNKI